MKQIRNMGDLAVNALTLAFPVQMLRIADRRALCGVVVQYYYSRGKRLRQPCRRSCCAFVLFI